MGMGGQGGGRGDSDGDVGTGMGMGGRWDSSHPWRQNPFVSEPPPPAPPLTQQQCEGTMGTMAFCSLLWPFLGRDGVPGATSHGLRGGRGGHRGGSEPISIENSERRKGEGGQTGLRTGLGGGMVGKGGGAAAGVHHVHTHAQPAVHTHVHTRPPCPPRLNTCPERRAHVCPLLHTRLTGCTAAPAQACRAVRGALQRGWGGR